MLICCLLPAVYIAVGVSLVLCQNMANSTAQLDAGSLEGYRMVSLRA